MDMDDRPPTLAGIEKALELIRPYVPETPLVHAPLLSDALGMDLWLKAETATAIGSFKIRAAFCDLIRATKRERPSRVVAASSGNHGQAVALAARTLGLEAEVFVAAGTGAHKITMIEAYGARVHVGGTDVDAARDAALAHAADHGHYFVNEGMSVVIMEGAATMAYEVAHRLDGIDALIVPMGGGNLAAGSAAAMKAMQPRARTIGVQPAAAPVVARAFHAHEPLEIAGESVADALVGRITYDYTLRMLWEYLDDAWLVSEEGIMAAMHTLLVAAHVLVEPGGGVALTAAWDQRRALHGRRVVLALTGATASAEQITRALATPAYLSLS